MIQSTFCINFLFIPFGLCVSVLQYIYIYIPYTICEQSKCRQSIWNAFVVLFKHCDNMLRHEFDSSVQFEHRTIGTNSLQKGHTQKWTVILFHFVFESWNWKTGTEKKKWHSLYFIQEKLKCVQTNHYLHWCGKWHEMYIFSAYTYIYIYANKFQQWFVIVIIITKRAQTNRTWFFRSVSFRFVWFYNLSKETHSAKNDTFHASNFSYEYIHNRYMNPRWYFE